MTFKSKKPKLATGLLLAAAAAVFLAFACDARLETTFYELHSEKVSSEIKIALVTDLHSDAYGAREQELIAAIDAQAPDIVVMSGDMTDITQPVDNTLFFMSAIAQKYPCYYVTGNHEYKSGKAELLKTSYRAYGVTVLEGGCTTVEINGSHLNICGVDDSLIGCDAMLSQLESCANKAQNGLYTVLLAHKPEFIDDYLEYGFDLVLCGHMHGGQWRIPGLVNGLVSPEKGLFPKYAAGLYSFGDASMIVSRGLARESSPFPRIFNRPELAIITIAP